MKNETKRLYAQLSKLIEDYNEAKAAALQKVTDFANEHGLIAAIYDDNLQSQTQYIPTREADDIIWENKDQKEQFEYVFEQYTRTDFQGQWVTSSHFC